MPNAPNTRTTADSSHANPDRDAAGAVERIVDAYADLIVRLAYARLASLPDAQDVCQTVLLKYLTLDRQGLLAFSDAEHEKAWLIRTTINACIDLQRSGWRRAVVPLETAEEPTVEDVEDTDAALDAHRDVLDAVNGLPPAYRQAVYLHYFEGYAVKDIAALTGEKPATVSAHLSRARAKLRTILGGSR